MEGKVISGANNFFCVEDSSGNVYHCSIKGKVLRLEEASYNPLCPGDVVEIEVVDEKVALILSLKQRRNCLKRLNIKTYTPQILGANIDLILALTTPSSPPFRPRFVDRLIVEAEREDIPIVIVVNKWDLSNGASDVELRLEDWEKLGYEVMRVSARTGDGVAELKRRVSSMTCVLVGQSGVGKSSLLNALEPSLCLKSRALSSKYDRGVHTTTKSELFHISNTETDVIDTPGIRNFSLCGIEEAELISYFREMEEVGLTCKFGASCRHEGEAGCAVLKGVEDGAILQDRYESYLRIKEEIRMLKEKM